MSHDTLLMRPSVARGIIIRDIRVLFAFACHAHAVPYAARPRDVSVI